MRRTLKLAALILLTAVLMTGCVNFGMEGAEDPNATPQPTMLPLTDPVYTDRDALYELYNEVDPGVTKDELIERYGEPKEETDDNGTTYVWTNEAGYGFAAVFFDNNCLRAKVLYYDDLRQLKGLSAATSVDNVSLLNDKHNFSAVCLAMGGKPMEIAALVQDSSVNPEVKRLFAWIDEEGSFVQVLFGADEMLEEASFYFAEPEPTAEPAE